MRVADIDPVFYDKTYYAGSRDEADAFRLLRDALQKTDLAGIGRFTFRDREYLVALRAARDVLVMHTLRFHDEVTMADELELEEGLANRAGKRSTWPERSSSRWRLTSHPTTRETRTAARSST